MPVRQPGLEVMIMANLIEVTDRKQRKYWKGFMIAFCLAIALLAVRALFYYGFGEYDLNSQPIGIVVLAFTIFLLILQVYFLVKLGRLRGRVKTNPQLKEAILEDEFAKLHAIKSWMPAFIGAVVTPFFFLLVSSFYPFCDLLTVALSTALVGCGVYLASYYFRSRA
jgi:hypothetical protein